MTSEHSHDTVFARAAWQVGTVKGLLWR